MLLCRSDELSDYSDDGPANGELSWGCVVLCVAIHANEMLLLLLLLVGLLRWRWWSWGKMGRTVVTVIHFIPPHQQHRLLVPSRPVIHVI